MDPEEVVTEHHCPGCSLKVMSNRCVFSLLLKVAHLLSDVKVKGKEHRTFIGDVGY